MTSLHFQLATNYNWYYSPELNPVEKIWAILKRKFTNKMYHSLKEISEFIDKETKDLTKEIIKSVCAYQYIYQNIDWSI